MNATELIKDDHKKVKQLFKQFDKADKAHDEMTKVAIIEQVISELQIHTELEEQAFYPEIRQLDDEAEELIEEAEEEHHVVDILIAEIRQGGLSSADRDAKFTVLKENVKHHIQEEEEEMLPKSNELGKERLEELGQEMQAMKRKRQGSMNGGMRQSTMMMHDDEMIEMEGAGTNGRSASPRGGSGSTSGGGRRAPSPSAAARGGRRSAATRKRSNSTRGTRSSTRSSTRGRSTTSRGRSTAARGRNTSRAGSRSTSSRGSSSRSAASRGTSRSAATRSRSTPTRSRSGATSSTQRRRSTAGRTRSSSGRRTSARSR